MNKPLKRICIIGPESTGKSELCAQLAAHYDTHFVPEFARDYLIEKNNEYTKEDLFYIASEQLKLEQELSISANRFLFVDNDFINIKIWMQEVFHVEEEYINHLVRSHVYDLYLLCDIDIPWQADILRQNEHNRVYLYNRFYEELVIHNFPHEKIAGLGLHRLMQAIQKIDLHFT